MYVLYINSDIIFVISLGLLTLFFVEQLELCMYVHIIIQFASVH